MIVAGDARKKNFSTFDHNAKICLELTAAHILIFILLRSSGGKSKKNLWHWLSLLFGKHEKVNFFQYLSEEVSEGVWAG